jgi:hypothetical protein
MQETIKTADHKRVGVGDRVETNNLKLGTIISIGYDGWADVLEDDGYKTFQNGPRLRGSFRDNGERIV